MLSSVNNNVLRTSRNGVVYWGELHELWPRANDADNSHTLSLDAQLRFQKL